MTYPPERYPPDPGQQPPHPPPVDPFLNPSDPYAGGGNPYPGYPPPGPASPYPPPAPASPTPYPGSPATPYPGSPATPYPGSPATPYPGSPASPYPPSESTSLYPPGHPGGGYQPPGAGGGYGPPGPGGPYGPAGPPFGPPPRRSRRGLLIAGIGLVAVLVLCGGIGGAVLLLNRDGDRNGAESPTAAVHEFLQAVYRDMNPEAAASRVCSEARDESTLTTKIDEIAAYESAHVEPRFTWTPPQVVDDTGDITIVATTVTMVTGDERTADLSLRVSVLDKDQHGWWVCNLETVSSETGAPPAENESPEPEESDGSVSGEDDDADG